MLLVLRIVVQLENTTTIWKKLSLLIFWFMLFSVYPRPRAEKQLHTIFFASCLRVPRVAKGLNFSSALLHTRVLLLKRLNPASGPPWFARRSVFIFLWSFIFSGRCLFRSTRAGSSGLTGAWLVFSRHQAGNALARADTADFIMLRISPLLSGESRHTWKR